MSKYVMAVTVSTPIQEAVNTMFEKGRDSPAVEKGGKALGIVTDRDFVELIALDGVKKNMGEILTSPLVKVPLNAELLDVLRTISENRIKHVLVEENRKLTGVITFRNIGGKRA